MKKKYNILILAIIAISTLLSSCKAKFYTPNRNPVPLFKNTGDVYIDASSNLLNKYDITAGYAIAKGLGGYAGYAGAREKIDNTPGSPRKLYKGDMLNFGLGYFLNQEQSQSFRFEVFGDLGLGSFRNTYFATKNEFFNGNYTRIGIMPNFGYSSTDNKFNFAYSIRISSITFSNTIVSDTGFWESDISRLNSKSNYGMLEHGFTFRGGSENLKFQAQWAF